MAYEQKGRFKPEQQFVLQLKLLIDPYAKDLTRQAGLARTKRYYKRRSAASEIRLMWRLNPCSYYPSQCKISCKSKSGGPQVGLIWIAMWKSFSQNVAIENN